MSKVQDAIIAAIQDNPTEFADHISSALMDRLGDALAVKRVEVATSMFGPEETAEVEEEEIDDQD